MDIPHLTTKSVTFNVNKTLPDIIMSKCRHFFTSSKTLFTLNFILSFANLLLDILQF
jgi:hypothetical protein